MTPYLLLAVGLPALAFAATALLPSPRLARPVALAALVAQLVLTLALAFATAGGAPVEIGPLRADSAALTGLAAVALCGLAAVVTSRAPLPAPARFATVLGPPLAAAQCLAICVASDHIGLGCLALAVAAHLAAGIASPGPTGVDRLVPVAVATTLLALMVTLLTAAAPGVGAAALRWSVLGNSPADMALLRLAAVAGIASLGLLSGLAPFHRWLADHGRRPRTAMWPITGGGLVAAALLTLGRLHALAGPAMGDRGRALLVVGVLTVLAAATRLILLEEMPGGWPAPAITSAHAGVICFALGVSGPAAQAGLLHLLGLVAAQSLLAVTADLRPARGAGAWRGLGALAVVGFAGLPPLSTFVSLVAVLVAAVSAGHAAAALILLGGIAAGGSRVIAASRVRRDDPHLSEGAPEPGAPGWVVALPLGVLLLAGGFYIPLPLGELLSAAARLLHPAGGTP